MSTSSAVYQKLLVETFYMNRRILTFKNKSPPLIEPIPRACFHLQITRTNPGPEGTFLRYYYEALISRCCSLSLSYVVLGSTLVPILSNPDCSDLFDDLVGALSNHPHRFCNFLSFSQLPSYRVGMIIEDKDDQARLVLMGKQAEELFGATCEELLSRSYPTEQTLAPEITDKLGEAYLFEIKVNFKSDLVVRHILRNLAPSVHPNVLTPAHPPHEKKRPSEICARTLFIYESEKKSKRQTDDEESSSSAPPTKEEFQEVYKKRDQQKKKKD